MTYSCSLPLPPGSNNISNDPQFVSSINKNWRLKSKSPCVNTGTNSDALLTLDLAGLPRIIDVIVDMGCFEYGLPTGIVTHKINELHVFPNPVSDVLTLDLDSKYKSISIINMEGKTILQKEIGGNDKLILDVSEFDRGIYVVIAQLDKGVSTSKVIVE